MKMKRPTISELSRALIDGKSHISDDMKNDDDSLPSIDVTLSCDEKGFSLQFGDNSYSGSAYLHQHWGVSSLYRRSNTRELAKELINQCQELFESSNP